MQRTEGGAPPREKTPCPRFPNSLPTARVAETPAAVVVALAASAGGLQALSRVPVGCPATCTPPSWWCSTFPPTITVCRRSGCRTTLTVKQAEQGELLREGTVYVAPPGQHLLVVAGGTLALTRTKLVHFTRPRPTPCSSRRPPASVRVLAVVLTGYGCDGAAGAAAVALCRRPRIAQDQATSECFGHARRRHRCRRRRPGPSPRRDRPRPRWLGCERRPE